MVVLACALVLDACGREQPDLPTTLPGFRLEAVSPPRFLGDERARIAFGGPLASGTTQIGILSTTVPPPAPDHTNYHVLDRRSGEEVTRYSMPIPDLLAASGDDLVVEWFAYPVSCTGQSSLALYEGFRDGVPAGEG